MKNNKKMDFCMLMAKHLMMEEITKPTPENSVLSPLSINVVLNMIAAGTTGATLENMLKLLKSSSIDEINNKSHDIMAVANNTDNYGPTITSINGVWVTKRYPVKNSYKELLKRIYDCEANTDCDFANKANEVRHQINSWAEAASRGLIKDLIGKIDPDISYIRANALYFKGTWADPFVPEFTTTKDFFLVDGTIIQVPFLTKYGGYEYYGSFDNYSVLKLPYEGGLKASFSMYFFLPHEKNKLSYLLENLEEFHSDLGLKQTGLDLIRIPKFKFFYEFDASETMESMGLEIPHNGNKLDFAEMIEVPEDLPPINSRILQKAYIEVEECGTEASAVTEEEDDMGFFLDDYGPPPPPRPKFVADHPFMFVIKEDKSGLVFFTGVIVNPELINE